MSECQGSQCARNGCGHTFCKGCWKGHLQAQIGDGNARHVTCMAYKCGVVCDEELVMDVIQVGGAARGLGGGAGVLQSLGMMALSPQDAGHVGCHTLYMRGCAVDCDSCGASCLMLHPVANLRTEARSCTIQPKRRAAIDSPGSVPCGHAGPVIRGGELHAMLA